MDYHILRSGKFYLKGICPMKTLTEKALKGRKKKKLILYNKYKNDMYSYCKLLIEDEAKAEDIMLVSVASVWEKASLKNITDENDFQNVWVSLIAKLCCSELFGKSEKAFKVGKTNSFDIPKIEKSEYSGNIESGMKCLKKSLNDINDKQKFIFLLHDGLNLNFKEISTLIKQRESVAKFYYNGAVSEIIRNLPSGVLTFDKIESLLEKSRCETIPASLDDLCITSIKKRKGKKK